MQEKELHKLGKTDLLTLIYKQEKQIQRLTKEVEELKQQLDDRTIKIQEAGSIAEASLKINKIFEVAQQAADEYLRSIKEVNKPSHECAEINENTSKDKANTENQNDFQSEDTYEENTNDKNTKELILVNNKIMLPKVKLFKRVLVLLMLIGGTISKFAIKVAKNTVVFSKKIKLGIKINFIKLKCKIVIVKNYLKLILKKIANRIVRFVKLCKKLAIALAKKTKRKIRRTFRKFKCNLEKSKRKIKRTLRIVRYTTKKARKALIKNVKAGLALIRKFIKETIEKCKVRLVVRKFKIRNKKASKTKLLEKAIETKCGKTESLNEIRNEKIESPNETENALIPVNNNIVLYILIYVKKYLKLLKAFIAKISIKTGHTVKKLSKKVVHIVSSLLKKVAHILRKLLRKIAKHLTILKMKFTNKIRHTKLINEINDHIHIEETKNALIPIETGIKPFKQKMLVKLLILLKKAKIKITILSLKTAKKIVIVANKAGRKLLIIAKKTKRKLVPIIKSIAKKTAFIIKRTARILKIALKKLKRKTIKVCKKVIVYIKKTIIKIRDKIKEKKNLRQMSKDTHTAIIKNLQISMPDLERELKRRKEKNLKLTFIKTLAFSAMVVVAFAIITSTSFFKILQVSGTSMEPTLHEGELLITSKFFKYEKGDMVAFYYNDSVLIKRVIATENDIVNIEYDGTVYVNSVKLEESYVKELSLGNCDITFPYQVPKNSVFILGDNRKDSIDSRSKSIGSISTEKIIGKIRFRLNPFVIY